MLKEGQKAPEMLQRDKTQSEFMTALLSDVERFRSTLTKNSEEKVTLKEALQLWIAHGHARKFRRYYTKNQQTLHTAHA